jgi:large exoprotein involved in heme utilization and adhesion
VTPNEICTQIPNKHIITRLSDKQLHDITTAVSSQYDSVIKQMQEAHKTQITSILQTQQAQENEIHDIKVSQQRLRTDMQDQMDQKMTSQTSLLHSMMTMIQDIKQTQLQDKMATAPATEKLHHCTHPQVKTPTIINHSQDHDISYSESDSEHDSEGQTESMTAATVQSSVVSSRQGSATYVRKIDNNPSRLNLHPSNTEISNNSASVHHTNESPECDHVNRIVVDSNDDIRKVTLTSAIEPSAVAPELGWNNVTVTSKKKVPLRHALISPPKRQTRSMYTRSSPNYNKYDPTGSIPRMSQRLKNKQSKQMNDRSSPKKERVLPSDRRT